MKRENALRGVVTNLVVIWECDLHRQMAEDASLKTRLTNYQVKTHTIAHFMHTFVQIRTRLRIRDALQGGRVEPFRMMATAGNGNTIHYYDVTS